MGHKEVNIPRVQEIKIYELDAICEHFIPKVMVMDPIIGDTVHLVSFIKRMIRNEQFVYIKMYSVPILKRHEFKCIHSRSYSDDILPFNPEINISEKPQSVIDTINKVFGTHLPEKVSITNIVRHL